MNKTIIPRGAHFIMRGIKKCVGIKWRAAILLGGILIGFILISPVKAHANGLSYQPSYEDGIPEDIRIYCELVGSEFQICPEILEAIAYHESRFIPDVTNNNYYGMMQVDVKVHAQRIEKYGWAKNDMLDAYKNLIVAGDLLHELYLEYGDENPIVLSYYAGNTTAIEYYYKTGQTTGYAKEILELSEKYERLHGK